MRLITVLSTTVTMVVLVAAVLKGSDEKQTEDGPRLVVASVYPVAYAAEQIGGGETRVEELTPPGAEPHDLEVTPGAVEKLRSANLMLLLGHGFQPQLERAASSDASALKLLDTPGLALSRNRDPHVWLDPLRFAVVARRVGRALGAEARAARFVARLRAMDRRYRVGLARCARRELVTSHDAFAYLAQRYGLRQIPISGLSAEAEPTAADLTRVVADVRRTRARTVYFEPLVSPETAETVARETGASTASLNPIEGLTPTELARGEDYFSLMRENLAALRTGLGCR